MKSLLSLLALAIVWFPLQAGAMEIEESDSFIGPADFNKVMASLGITPTQSFMSWYGPIPNVALKEIWVERNKLMRRTAYITEAEAAVVYEWDSIGGVYDIWVYVLGYYDGTEAEISTIPNSWLLTETVSSFSISDSVFQGDLCFGGSVLCDSLVNIELKGSINKKTGELSVSGKFKGGVYGGGYMFSGTVRFKLPLDTGAASTLSGSRVLEKIEKIRNMRRFKQ
jgi:hypothetical protein